MNRKDFSNPPSWLLTESFSDFANAAPLQRRVIRASALSLIDIPKGVL